MITHAIELLTAGSTQAEILIHEEQSKLGGISIEELQRLVYAQVLSSHAMTWNVSVHGMCSYVYGYLCLLVVWFPGTMSIHKSKLLIHFNVQLDLSLSIIINTDSAQGLQGWYCAGYVDRRGARCMQVSLANSKMFCVLCLYDYRIFTLILQSLEFSL